MQAPGSPIRSFGAAVARRRFCWPGTDRRHGRTVAAFGATRATCTLDLRPRSRPSATDVRIPRVRRESGPMKSTWNRRIADFDDRSVHFPRSGHHAHNPRYVMLRRSPQGMGPPRPFQRRAPPGSRCQRARSCRVPDDHHTAREELRRHDGERDLDGQVGVAGRVARQLDRTTPTGSRPVRPGPGTSRSPQPEPARHRPAAPPTFGRPGHLLPAGLGRVPVRNRPPDPGRSVESVGRLHPEPEVVVGLAGRRVPEGLVRGPQALEALRASASGFRSGCRSLARRRYASSIIAASAPDVIPSSA